MPLALIVGLSMFAKDMLGTGVIVFLDRKQALRAGICDALGDLAAVATYGVGGVEVMRLGVSTETVLILAGMTAGSLAGTVVGSRLSERLAGAVVPVVAGPVVPVLEVK